MTAPDPATGNRDRHAPGLGLAIMTCGFMLMPLTDGIAKILGTYIAPGEIAWGRFVFQGILLLPLVVFSTGWASLIPRKPLGNAIRGVLMAVGTAMFFIGLRKIPLADSAAIFFIMPFVLTILSVIVEGEKVGWRRWSAIVVGFGGAMLVIQPSFNEFGLYALLPAASAVCFAFYMLLNRRLRDTGSAIAMQVFAGLSGMVTLSILLVIGTAAGAPDFTFTMPTPLQWAVLAGIGAVAAFGHYCMVVAFRYATPAVLAPTQYTQIISSTIFGLVVFNDFPSPGQWGGIAIVIACGIYIFLRETRKRRV